MECKELYKSGPVSKQSFKLTPLHLEAASKTILNLFGLFGFIMPK